jgi:hypothetical protein
MCSASWVPELIQIVEAGQLIAVHPVFEAATSPRVLDRVTSDASGSRYRRAGRALRVPGGVFPFRTDLDQLWPAPTTL